MKDQNIQMRKITDSDIEEYKKLRHISLQTDPNAYFLRYADAMHRPTSYFLTEIKSDPGLIYGFYGAFDQDILVGMISLQKVNTTTAQLFTFYVLPEYRGNGIGRELLEYCLSLAKEVGINSFVLTVIEGNEALHLYESLGFTITNKKIGALKNENGTFNELILQR